MILHCRYIPVNTLKQALSYPEAERGGDMKIITGKTTVIMLAALLALTMIPIAAFATDEDTLEPAPEIILTAEAAGEENESAAEEPLALAAAEDSYADHYFWEDPYLPDCIYPNHDEDVQDQEWIYSDPGLTLAETNRIRELMAAVEAGEKSLADVSYPEHPDELKIGVYPVDPADFAGENFYLTLPSRRMKDNDLLYLLSCFEQLDIPFDPDELYSRNCMRGFMNDGTTRKLSQEENERMTALRHQIANGTLTEEDIHPETECKTIDTWFGPFSLYPYRRMTDDELAAFALRRESRWENDPDEVEKAARDFAGEVLELPLSMKLTETSRSLIPYSNKAEGYGLTFRVEYTDAEGKTLETTGKPCQVYVYLRRRMDNGTLAGSMIDVQLYSDINIFFMRQAGEAKSREEKIEIGTEWLKENVLCLDDSYNYTYDDDFGYYRIWAEKMDWAFFVEMAEDGWLERFSAQKIM